MSVYDSLYYFDAHEFSAPDLMDETMLHMLDRMRALAGVPIVINSSYRQGDDGAHGRGHAVDIKCKSSRHRMLLVRAAIDAGFRRIGVYDKHLHLDNDSTLVQDVMWHGLSQ